MSEKAPRSFWRKSPGKISMVSLNLPPLLSSSCKACCGNEKEQDLSMAHMKQDFQTLTESTIYFIVTLACTLPYSKASTTETNNSNKEYVLLSFSFVESSCVHVSQCGESQPSFLSAGWKMAKKNSHWWWYFERYFDMTHSLTWYLWK